jgi:hypothetical protein
MDNYKIQTKIGSAEFSAEGAEESVRADYDRFLRVLETRPAASDFREANGSSGQAAESAGDLDEPLLQAVFKTDQEHGWVSLKVLPPADSSNRAADAALILIYGFHRVLGQSEAPVTKLLGGLRESGISIDRFDRIIAAHSSLILKGGQKIGAKYRLNNQGMIQAAAMIRQFFN